MFRLLFFFLCLFPTVALAQPHLLDVPPRGIETIPCNLPEARESCRSVVFATFISGVNKPTLNYLVDGSFGFDENAMIEDIELLSRDERKPEVIFYLHSGPGQRNCQSRPVGSGFGSSYLECAGQFSRQMLTDINYQESFRKHISRLRPVIEYAFSRGAKVWIVPSLEDNLNWLVVYTMAAIAARELPVGIKLMRNAGHTSDGVAIPGFGREKHLTNPKQVTFENGFVSNDGVTFTLSKMKKDKFKRRVALSTLGKVQAAAKKKGLGFILWYAPAQGLYAGSTKEDPKKRDYYVLNTAEQIVLAFFLRQ